MSVERGREVLIRSGSWCRMCVRLCGCMPLTRIEPDSTKAKNFQDSWDSSAYDSSHISARFTRAPLFNPSLRASTGSIFGI